MLGCHSISPCPQFNDDHPKNNIEPAQTSSFPHFHYKSRLMQISCILLLFIVPSHCPSPVHGHQRTTCNVIHNIVGDFFSGSLSTFSIQHCPLMGVWKRGKWNSIPHSTGHIDHNLTHFWGKFQWGVSNCSHHLLIEFTWLTADSSTNWLKFSEKGLSGDIN